MVGIKSITQALNINPAVSSEMERAIELWGNMYNNKAPWLHEPNLANPVKIVSLGLPAFIASEKARTATIEMKSVITDPSSDIMDKDRYVTASFEPKTRAEYLNKQYQLNFLPDLRKELEYGIAKGGLVIKPYIYDDTELEFIYCQADEFYPISFDATGKITEAAFIERLVSRNIQYTRLEYHKLDLERRQVRVENRAYKLIFQNTAPSDGELGTEIKLSDVEAWKHITPEVIINDVDRLLFAYFRMPEANTVDSASPLGVSGFSRATQLIREADEQFSRMLWEYEGGELAVDIDPLALKTVEVEENGKKVKKEIQNVHQARLFRKADIENTYSIYAPALRDTSYMNGLNSILMRIEDACGISRGTISDITRSEAKTATEMLIMRQRSYATNLDIQKALQYAMDDLIYVMDVYATLYNLAPYGEYTVSYEWDDSLISSPEEELQRRLTLKDAGIESALNIRMWYYGETEEQAQKALDQIESEGMNKAKRQAIATGLVQDKEDSKEEQATDDAEETETKDEEVTEDA